MGHLTQLPHSPHTAPPLTSYSSPSKHQTTGPTHLRQLSQQTSDYRPHSPQTALPANIRLPAPLTSHSSPTHLTQLPTNLTQLSHSPHTAPPTHLTQLPTHLIQLSHSVIELIINDRAPVYRLLIANSLYFLCQREQRTA